MIQATINNKMEIKVQLRNQYGNRVCVPFCEKAKIFADIAGTKTLSITAINGIKALGYTVTVVPTEPSIL